MNRKEWLTAVIITFVTICVWVTFDILHTRAQVTVPQKLQEITEPVNPNFDITVLESAP